MLECGGGGRGGDGKAKEHLCPFPLVPTSALSQGNFRPLSPPSNLFPPVVPGPPVSARPWASVPSVRGALLSGEGEEGESPRGALQRTRSPDTLPGGCGYASMAKAKKKMQLQPPHGHAGGGRGASMLAGHMRGSLPPAPRPLRTPAASMSFPGHGDNNPTTTSSSSSPASPTPSPDTAGAADTLAATQWVEDFFHGCSLKRASDAERGGGVQDEMQHPRLELIRVGRDGKRGTALRACSSNSPGGGSANLVGLTHAQMGGDEKQKSHDSLSRVPPESPPTGNEDDSDWHIVQGAGGALGSRGECTEDRGESESLEQKEANQNEAPKALVGEMEGEMNDEEGEGDEDIDADPEPAPPVSASLLRPHSGGKFEDGGGDGREQGAGESSVIQTPASTPLQKDKPTPREEAYPSPSPASESVSSTPLVSAAAARGPGMDPDNVNAEGPMQVPEAPRSAATAAAVGAAFPAPFYSHFGMHPHHPAAAAAFAHPAHAPLFAHAAAAESHSHAAAAYAAASGFPFFPPSFGLVSQAAAAFGAPVSSSSFHFPHAHATGGQLLSGGASTASPETNNPSCMSLLPHLYCVPLTMNNGLPAPCGTDSYSQKHTTPASAATPVPSRQTIPGHSLTQTQTQTLTQAAPPSQQGSVSLSHSHSQQQPQAAGWGPLPPSTATAASLSLSFGSTHSHAGGPSGSVSSALQTHPPPPVSHTHAGLSAHMRSRSHSLRTSELFFDLDRHHMASASSASAAMGTQQPQQFQSQPPAPLSQTHSSFHIQTAYPPPSSLYPFHQPTAASHFSHTPQNSHSHVTAPSTSTAATSANAAGAGGSPSTVPAPSSHHHQVQQQQLMQGGDRVPVDKHDASYYAKPGVPSGLGFVSSATVTSASPPSSSPVTSAAAARTTTASSSQQRFNHPHLPQQQQQQQPPRTPGGLAHHHQSQQQQQQYVQKAAATGPHGQQQGSSAVQAAAGARGSAPSHLPARATLPFPGHAHHHLTNATSTCGGAVRAQTRGGSAGAPSGVLKEPRQQQPSGDTAVSAGLGPPGPGTDSPFVSSAAGAPGGLGVHEQTQNGLSLLPPPPTLCLPSEADRHRSKAETGDAEGVAVKSGTQQGENDLNSQHDWDNGGEGGNANSIQNLPRASGSFSTVVEGLGRDRSDAGGVGPLKDAELPSAHRGVSRGGPSGVPPNSRVSVTHQAVPPSSTLSLSSPPASVVSLRNSKLSSTPSNVVSALTAPPSRPQPVPAVPPAPLTPSPNPSPSPSPGSSAGFSTAAAAAAGTDTVSNSRPPPLPPLHLSSTTTGAQTNPQQAGTYTQTYAPSVPAAASAAAGGLSFSASGSQSFVPSAHMTGGGAVPLYTGFSSAGTYASYQPTSALFQQQQQSQGGQNRPVSPPSAQSPSVPAAAVMAPPSPAHPPGSSGSATAPSSYSMPLPVALQLPLPMPLWPQFYSSSSSSSNVITSSCSSHDPVNNMM
uniref:Uncharacterized protein n=1 Tax=Chromera velia CCMP2878 TaxID=1169474 RepID=A0A0G4EZQ2_9ALVE|eukprot:Cvel_14361.t1-p1 / transcript=Cvel_14361.t1 / gene=Cvel_14361 / organism=Chromera_velia_CCMP2878 / gene_product=hypothetical protein / transcript_product=hypothetical protein / location=Cvel_scaffold1018:50462-54841(-) / protein_length=1460 / sequence_SO=supercontig / SO=protein_coding / is_pseudo=false